MALVHGDRVLETTTHTGSGSPVTLAGAVSGHRAFSTVATVNNDTFYYTMRLGTEWEVGLGTRNSSTTFTRTTVIASSNAGAAVVFSAGSKEVWMDIPARLLQLFTPSPNPSMINGILSESHAAGAVTYSVKTMAGATPSVSDPVFFLFLDDNAVATGVTIRIVTAALSITVPSGATLGVVGAKCPRIWIAAMDAAGTVELAVRNCYDDVGKQISWFPTGDNRITTTIMNTSSDSAMVSYSTTARSNLAFIVLGYFTYNTTLAVAGTWDVDPNGATIFTPQSSKAGDVVQIRYGSTTTAVVAPGSGTFVDSAVAVTITLNSFANAVRVRNHAGVLSTNNSTSEVAMRLRNTSLGVTVGGPFPVGINFATSTVAIKWPVPTMYGMDKPCTVGALTYKVQFYDIATVGTKAIFTDGGYDAAIVVEEVMT